MTPLGSCRQCSSENHLNALCVIVMDYLEFTKLAPKSCLPHDNLEDDAEIIKHSCVKTAFWPPTQPGMICEVEFQTSHPIQVMEKVQKFHHD